MKKLYPLKFAPVLKERVWGGDTMGDHIGEAWIVSDMEGAESVVSNGFLEENDLPDILETYLGDLVGDKVFEYYNLQFPVLVKLLDINDRFSVQVHPSDQIAFERYDSYGKSEFWYVTDADPDAVIYMGFKKNTDAGEFYRACKEGRAHELLNVYHPKKGDCFYVEAGIVHSAGGGVRTVEIQEASDITFRLYDWGRENNPATSREMHLEEAIDCINYDKYDEAKYHFADPGGIAKLVDSRNFIITSISLEKSLKVSIEEYNSFAIYVCCGGSAEIRYRSGVSEEVCTLSSGEAVLVPASMDEIILAPTRGKVSLLEVRMPELSDEDDYVKDGRDQN